MRQYRFPASLLLLLLLGLPWAADAQDIKFKKDLVSVDGAAYCQFDSKALGTQLQFSTLEGTLFCTVDQESAPDPSNVTGMFYYRVIRFPALGLMAEAKDDQFSFKKWLVEQFLAYGILKDGQPDAEAIARFCQLHASVAKPGSAATSAPSTAAAPQVKYDLVTRSTFAPVFILNGDIRQDNRLIGKCSERSEARGGKIMQDMEIFTPDGLLIASAENLPDEKGIYLLRTLRDGQTHRVDADSTLATKVLKEIAQYMIGKGYL